MMEPWSELLNSGVDIALLQEAREPPAGLSQPYDIIDGTAPWRTVGANRPWRTAIVRLSDAVKLREVKSIPIDSAETGEFISSRPGTISAAELEFGDPVYTE